MSNRLTLSEMLNDLRSEVGHSLVAAHGINTEDSQKYLLQRVQRELFVAYDWPVQIGNEDVAFQAGDRYIPTLTVVEYEQINDAWVKEASIWRPMLFDITPNHYSISNSEEGQRSWPILRYRYDPVEDKVEIWPMPSQDGTMRVRGQIGLLPLVDDADISSLDGTLIVLFAASEILARQEDEDAAMKLSKAQLMLAALMKQSGSQKREVLALGKAGRRYYPRYGRSGYIMPNTGHA